MATKRKRLVNAVLPSHSACIGGVCDPQRTQGLRAPAPKGSYTLVSLKGPGLFLSANVTKQGGATDLSFVSLDIDGRNVVNMSYAALRNIGLVQANPYGTQYSTGGAVESFSIGWPFPLTFKRSLELSVTVNETGVVQILGNVVRGGL
jgi:hypothetical protein